MHSKNPKRNVHLRAYTSAAPAPSSGRGCCGGGGGGPRDRGMDSSCAEGASGARSGARMRERGSSTILDGDPDSGPRGFAAPPGVRPKLLHHVDNHSGRDPAQVDSG